MKVRLLIPQSMAQKNLCWFHESKNFNYFNKVIYLETLFLVQVIR